MDMNKLTVFLNSKKFEVLGFLLLAILILVSQQYPGALDFSRDYRWLAARAFGQSETILQLIAQYGDLIDYKLDVGYDTLSYSQQPLNPFFILAHFINPFLGNYLAIMFMSVISLIYCRRIVGQAGLLEIFPILAAVFFLSQSLDHHFTSNLGLNSILAMPVYYVIACKVIKSEKPGLLDWSMILLAPLITDLHAPLILAFSALFAIGLNYKTIDLRGWTFKHSLILISILAIHAFGWLPWLSSSSERSEITLANLLNFKNIFVAGPNNLNELLASHGGYLGIFIPRVGSGTFFYMPVGFVFAGFLLMLRDRRHVFPRSLYVFSVALIVFAIFINSQYIYDILHPLSYFRFPLNIIPPLLMVSAFAALYNTKPSQGLIALFIAAFLVDFFMPLRGSNDPYIFVHYILAALVIWLGNNRDKQPLSKGVILSAATLYCVITIAVILPNAFRFEGLKPYKSQYIKNSVAGMQCLAGATGNEPFARILFSGVSQQDPGAGRMFSDDTSYLGEDSRGYNFTTFFLYREYIDGYQEKTQSQLFNGWSGPSRMPPEIVKLPTVDELRTAQIQYMGFMGKDWKSQKWWKENEHFFTYRASCQLAYEKMDVYALNPQKSDYVLTRKTGRKWHVDAMRDTDVIVPIAHRPTTRVYVNGIETPVIDQLGAIKVRVAKGSGEISYTNFNVKHLLAYSYFWFAMVSVAGLVLFGARRFLVTRNQ